jgi:hypothetical protein
VGAISLDLLASIAEVFRLTPVELLARAESAPPQGTARPLLRGRHVYTRLRTDAGTVINLHPTRMNANLVRQLDLSERRES